MHLCDVNTWLALTLGPHVHHSAARRWLETVDDPASVLFCRATQQSYLRLLTTRSVLAPYGFEPLTNRRAWAAFDALFGDDRISFRRDEPERLDSFWREYSSRASASPRVWMDAYLAAFARAAGCTLVTLDAGFRQFAGLDVVVLGAGEARS